MRVVLMNCSIVTSTGTFVVEKISHTKAVEFCRSADSILSAIGHKSTAEIMSTILPVKVEINRIKYQQEAGEIALVFQLNERLPEGKVLTKVEIQEIGYSWRIIRKYESDRRYPGI